MVPAQPTALLKEVVRTPEEGAGGLPATHEPDCVKLTPGKGFVVVQVPAMLRTLVPDAVPAQVADAAKKVWVANEALMLHSMCVRGGIRFFRSTTHDDDNGTYHVSVNDDVAPDCTQPAAARKGKARHCCSTSCSGAREACSGSKVSPLPLTVDKTVPVQPAPAKSVLTCKRM